MADAIEVELDGRLRSLHPSLVRSWCRCSICGDTRTGLRWTTPAEIPSGIQAVTFSQTRSTLDVTWSDGHRSQIDLDAIGPPKNARPETTALPMRMPRAMSYDDVIDTDQGLLTALDALATEGVALVRNAPAETDSIVRFAERFGPIRVTSYGQVQVFITSAEAKTAAHTGNAQHPHTDEPFRYCPPGFLFFHSMESSAAGQGTTLLVDGFAAAEQLRRDDPDAFDTLATTRVEFHRQHEGEVRFSTRSRILSVGDDGALEAVRLNTRCLAPIAPAIGDGAEVLDAVAALGRIVEDPRNQLQLHLHQGDLLVFDNHRVMHGRTEFPDDQPRHLRSCNVDRDEVHSRHRLLAHRVGAVMPTLATGPTT